MGAWDRRRLAGAATAALLASGCGASEDFVNDPRPPSPVVVTAAIVDERVSVSPAALGAGPIELIVTNQTDAAQQVTLESTRADRRLRQQTPPINPNGTAQIEVDVRPGTYRLSAGPDGIRAATLEVGPQRESAQDELLQP